MDMPEAPARLRHHGGPGGAPGEALRPPLVHVVDDDDAMRRSLALLLRAAGYAAEAHPSAEALLAALNEAGSRPGTPEPPRRACAVVDVLMPGGMDGIALQTELARRGAALPVVVVTGHADVPLAVRAMRAGAVDFVEKPYPKERILAAVGRALDAAAAAAAAAEARLSALTPRERMVLRGLVCGWPNKVIAHELGISPRTVEAHRAAMMDKLGARSLAEAVRLALAAGLDGEPER
ncbi:MAG: Two-component nitrogen fixation transcriptional regulator FixJ [uncultured Acetobacteraceae bacterium]|uniref:Two-component nitrogen fixation transcriptional regulator FixJ n=1 Tax=uncultured Acetobacteraceae bacterium TaxID=169975 RepID=A0A6J4HNV5_9PROT|nr:MAG: Two-component nitrogen fixation transcriptional regulator FixJ [uncultured Acetobacteraceae bacterium]